MAPSFVPKIHRLHFGFILAKNRKLNSFLLSDKVSG